MASCLVVLQSVKTHHFREGFADSRAVRIQPLLPHVVVDVYVVVARHIHGIQMDVKAGNGMKGLGRGGQERRTKK